MSAEAEQEPGASGKADTEIRDGMRISWDVPITMDDGLVLRADAFRPTEEGLYPVLLTYGPYAKGLSFQENYAAQWDMMVAEFPEVAAGSTNKYQAWEMPDPEKWVPDGYACVRVDSRGMGRSPGMVDLWSERETWDLYHCIEWAGTQPWSNGRVGLCGISYYAMNQYQVAALRPPHLTAICPWEGASDWYREFSHHGGILCRFPQRWFPIQVTTVQHGVGDRGPRSSVTGEPVAGPQTLSQQALAERRVDIGAEVAGRPVMDGWYAQRNPDLSRIAVPMLSAANWGGQGLHSRGNLEAFLRAGSAQKWLEVHGSAHWIHFYTDYGVQLQKRFFGHFLKGEETGWLDQPPVQLQVRHVGGFVERHEYEWPLARTAWTRLYLDAGCGLSAESSDDAGRLEFDALHEDVTFSTAPFDTETEITGPLSARLHVSSSTADADLFLVVRVFDPDGHEVAFMGALDPNTPVAQGWLRASHRKLDPARSRPYQPWHPHDEVQPLVPGEIYPLDVEIWPTCIVIPAGYRLGLTVQGADYQYAGELSDFARTFHYAGRGVGPFRHDDPDDRPSALFGGKTTVHVGGAHDSSLLVPVVPPKD